MTKNLWINLPVKDLVRSKAFFKEIGFNFNEKFGGNSRESACLEVGDKPEVVMLFVDSTFKNFTRNEISDTNNGTEVLLSIDASSRQEVDEMADKVKVAGGMVFAQQEEIDGWMYGCGFKDPDGHRWNVLYMDTGKMPRN